MVLLCRYDINIGVVVVSFLIATVGANLLAFNC